MHKQSEEVFEVVRSAAEGITEWRIDLTSVDVPREDLESPTAIAAFLMRKIQALRHVGRHGVSVGITAVLGLINETLLSLSSLFPTTQPTPIAAFIEALESAVVDITSIGSTHGWDAILDDETGP